MALIYESPIKNKSSLIYRKPKEKDKNIIEQITLKREKRKELEGRMKMLKETAPVAKPPLFGKAIEYIKNPFQTKEEAITSPEYIDKREEIYQRMPWLRPDTTQEKGLGESVMDSIKSIKDMPKEAFAGLSMLTDFSFNRVSKAVNVAISRITSPFIVSIFKALGDEQLEYADYDKIWGEYAQEEWERLANEVGNPFAAFNPLVGKEVSPQIQLLRPLYSKQAKKFHEQEEKGETKKAVGTFLEMVATRAMEEFAQPFWLFNIIGVSKGSFKYIPRERLLFKVQLNPAKDWLKTRFLKTPKKTKEITKVYKYKAKPNEYADVITKKGGKIKTLRKPNIKIYVTQTKKGKIIVRATNSGGEILPKTKVAELIKDTKMSESSKELLILSQGGIKPTKVPFNVKPIVPAPKVPTKMPVKEVKPTLPTKKEKVSSSPLIQEAKKYKTAEEFVGTVRDGKIDSKLRRRFVEMTTDDALSQINQKYGVNLTRVDFNNPKQAIQKFPQLKEPFNSGQLSKEANEFAETSLTDFFNRVKGGIDESLEPLAEEAIPKGKAKVLETEVVFDFAANSMQGNAWADIWKTDKGYFISVLDGNNKLNNGLFQITEEVYNKWKIDFKDSEFDNIYKNYKNLTEFVDDFSIDSAKKKGFNFKTKAEPLAQEARKFKSAEEFVKNIKFPTKRAEVEVLYDIKNGIKSKQNGSIIVNENGEILDGAHRFAEAKMRGDSKIEVIKIEQSTFDNMNKEQLSNLGVNLESKSNSIRKGDVFDKFMEENYYNKTKSQLTEIWNKAREVKPKKPKVSIKEVKPTVKPKKTEQEIKEDKTQELQARKWQVKMSKEPKTKKTINKTEIMQWAEKTFKIPIKGKATYKWKTAAGVYYSKAQIIRMKNWGELSVSSHEIAHHIDNVLKKKNLRWRNVNKKITKELADLDYDKKQRRTSEGFAEYIRHRMTTGKAKELAPEFDKFFNEVLNKNPRLKSNLKEFRNKLKIWQEQGAENRTIQHIDWKGEHTKVKGIKPKIEKAIKWINIKYLDEFYVPQQIVKEIEKIRGKKLRPTKNPAKLAEFSKAKSGAIARTFVEKKAINEKGEVIGPGLVEILKPIKRREMTTFIIYAVSKRALYLSKRNIESGFDIDDADYIVNKYKNKDWDKVSIEITKWSNHLVDWVINAGGLSKGAGDIMKYLNPVYLPFKRAFIDEAGVVTGIGGYVDKGGAIKGIKGSGRPIINPIEAMITQVRELISKAQKIRIAKLFALLSKEEGVGGFINRVPAPMKATTFNASQIKGYINEQIPDNLLISDEQSSDDLLTVFTQDFKYNGKENIVSIYINGKQEFYELHPDLYKALQAINPLQLGPLLKILAPFSRLLRLGATGLSLPFGLARNPFRDALAYAVFSKRNNATIIDPILGTYKSISPKEGSLIWRFKSLGGALSGQIGLDREAAQSTYDDLLLEKLGKTGKVLKVAKHPVDTSRNIISISELGPRSVELEKNYEKYTSPEWKKEHPEWDEEDAFVQAYLDAQDITINFTKSGEYGKKINQAAAFFNVAIRGPEKLYRSFRESPIETIIKGILWLTLPALYNWNKNKDKKWYKNLPPAYKYNNLFFETAFGVIRLPVPFELGTVFMSLPMAALDTMKEKDSKYLKGILNILKSQIPNPTPSMFAPLLDVASNKNWLGVPIESAGMQYLYPTERKRHYTRELAKSLSSGLNKMGIKFSPVNIDYLIDSYSGGFLKQFKITGKEMQDLPVIGALMLKNPFVPRRQLNEFFADYEVLSQKKESNIMTTEDFIKYARIEKFYSKYIQITKLIKINYESKNTKEIERLYKRMNEELNNIGYK